MAWNFENGRPGIYDAAADHDPTPAGYIRRGLLPRPETQEQLETLRQAGVEFENGGSALLWKVNLPKGWSIQQDSCGYTGRVVNADGQTRAVFMFAHPFLQCTQAGSEFSLRAQCALARYRGEEGTELWDLWGHFWNLQWGDNGDRRPHEELPNRRQKLKYALTGRY